MATEKTIRLSDEAQKILKDLGTPDWVMASIARSMKRENQFTIATIQKDHLTGRGPFPPEEHKLGVRTNRLRAAAWASDPVVRGSIVDSAIGDNVAYAAIHEFGGRIVHKARSGSVRLRTNAAGELLRQLGHPHLAVFAKPDHKRAKTVEFTSKEYEIEMPERAPFRTGIGERMDALGAAISHDLVEEWQQRGEA